MNVNSVGIDYVHEKIHEGKHFTATYSKALSAGSMLSVAITTPTAGCGYINFVAGVDSNLAGSWIFSRDATVGGGSALTAYNNNFNSSTTSCTTIVGTPTVTTYGTAIETHYVGSNTPPSRVGGSVEARNEYILATNTTYMVYFTANATSTYSAITLSFYLN